MKLSIILLFAMSLAILPGCISKSAAPTAPGGDTTSLTGSSWKRPGVGTAFTYQVVSRGLTAYDTVLDTEVVIDNDRAALGKQNVVATLLGRAQQYYHYETNGDISVGDSNDRGVSWMLLPTGGGASNADPAIDSVRTDGTRVHVAAVRSYVGREQLLLLSKSYAAYHVRELDTTSFVHVPDGVFDVRRASFDYWFIPEIGLLGKERIVNSDSSNSGLSGFSTDVQLVGYIPR